MIELEEVGGLRNMLMVHSDLLSKFVYKMWPDFGNEKVPRRNGRSILTLERTTALCE